MWASEPRKAFPHLIKWVISKKWRKKSRDFSAWTWLTYGDKHERQSHQTMRKAFFCSWRNDALLFHGSISRKLHRKQRGVPSNPGLFPRIQNFLQFTTIWGNIQQNLYPSLVLKNGLWKWLMGRLWVVTLLACHIIQTSDCPFWNLKGKH